LQQWLQPLLPLPLQPLPQVQPQVQQLVPAGVLAVLVERARAVALRAVLVILVRSLTSTLSTKNSP
jgi:hypothetical protein